MPVASLRRFDDLTWRKLSSGKRMPPWGLTIPVVVRLAKVGVAVTAMFWMVLMTPTEAVKLVALNWAMPFWAVEASLMVMVEPAPEALATERAPVRPFKLRTPPLPGQAWKLGAPTVDTRQSPEPPAV